MRKTSYNLPIQRRLDITPARWTVTTPATTAWMRPRRCLACTTVRKRHSY